MGKEDRFEEVAIAIWRVFRISPLGLILHWTSLAVDPAAISYYNEYDIESNTPKYNAVKALLKDLLGKGVPMRALGWQMHVKPGSFDPTTLLARMNEIA